ncbi:MAG: 50S ribosomal protein L22 [Chlamydiia bacterium]|nr:50S ribosomal protein L22 [Chlamydiia bacterium]
MINKIDNDGVAVAKYVRISPKRSRAQARDITKMPVIKALNILSFQSTKHSRVFSKVIKSAVSNFESKSSVRIEDMALWILQVDEGPTLKRGRPRNKGRTSPILKPTAHIKVVVVESTNLEKKREHVGRDHIGKDND